MEKKSLEVTIKELEKEYGKGSILHGKNQGTEENLEVVDSGSIGLNNALGIGGIACGKVYEIFGWESSGKSTLCQTIGGNFQRVGKKVIYVDGENSIERPYAEALGLNIDDLYIIQLDESGGEGAYNKVDKLVSTGEFGLVIYDSYNSLQPKSIIEGEVGDSTMGKHARMQGQAVMKANYLSSKFGTTFIFIGQMREKIGVMFGSPDTTQGGNALKFYAHVRMTTQRSITKENSVMDGDVKLGNQVTIKVIKNKMGAPFTSAKLDVLYGIGFDKTQEILDLGKDTEVLKIRAGIITYEDIKYPEAEFKDLLTSNPEFLTKIKSAILEKLAQPESSVPAEENE